MYIEFALPTGAGGMAASFCNQMLKKELEQWSKKYQIPYQTKLHKYTVRITFYDDKHYTIFALTWSPNPAKFKSWIGEFNIKDPMKVDRYK
jgi:hypothetical protein